MTRRRSQRGVLFEGTARVPEVKRIGQSGCERPNGANGYLSDTWALSRRRDCVVRRYAARVNSLRIALVTYSALPELFDDDAPLLVALTARGAAPVAAVWDDPDVDWSSFDLVVVRSTWDYMERLEEFLAWAERVSEVSVLANPAPVLRWNTDKIYLRDLEERGIGVVPTKYLDPDVHNEGRKIHARTPGRGQFVIKPTVSAGSVDTARYRAGDVDDRGEAMRHTRRLLSEGRAVMIQPYLMAIDDVGETALIYIGGLFSHAARKGAILEGFGSAQSEPFMAEQMSAREASAAERAVGDAVVAALPELVEVTGEADFPLLYARVDLVPDDEGNPLVLEVEVTEPSLFLRLAPGSVDRFADTIVARALRAGVV